MQVENWHREVGRARPTVGRIGRAARRRMQGARAMLDRLGPPPPQPTGCPPEFAVLLVCLGNICRSPMAEGILRRKLARAGLLGRVVVESAGTDVSSPGRGPDWRARACLYRYGDSIRDLRSRRFMRDDFDRFDLILAMDERTRGALVALASSDSERGRVQLLADGVDVEDPVELGPEAFEIAFREIDRATDVLLDQLADRIGQP